MRITLINVIYKIENEILPRRTARDHYIYYKQNNL